MTTVAQLPLAAGSGLSVDARKRDLADLHGYWDEIPIRARAVLLTTFAPGLSTQRRLDLWESYREQRQLETDLRSGWEDWRAVEPDLTCDDPQTEAANGARDRANGYLHELSTGENSNGI